MNLINPLPESALAEKPASRAEALPAVEMDERGILTITSIGHFLCHLAETIYPAVMLAVVDEFVGLDVLTAGLLVTLGYVLLGAGALPVGLWTDAWGPVRVFRVYFLMLAAAGLLVALTPNVWFLFGTVTLLGLAASIYHPAGLAMIALGIRSRGRAMGLNGIAGSLGSATGPTLGVGLYLLGKQMGEPSWWRVAYLVMAVLSLAALAYFQWLLKSAQTRGLAFPSSPRAHRQSRAHASPAETPPVAAWSFLPILLLTTAMVFGGLNYRVLMTALPIYIAEEQTSVSNETKPISSETSAKAPKQEPSSAGTGKAGQATLSVFLILLTGGIGQYLGGLLADRYGPKVVYPVLIGMVIPLGIIVGLLGGGLLVVAFAAVMAMCMFAQQPVENSVMAEQTSRRRQGLSYATKFTLTFGIGALGTPIAALIWNRSGSFGPAFFFIAGSAVVMGALALIALYISNRQPKIPCHQ